MGEDSIFNSNLPDVRDQIVQVADFGVERIKETVDKNAKILLQKMLATASKVSTNSSHKERILRVVDKMLFNYRNIGFIHLLYPEALILHTVRDPMDTLLSCFTQKFDDSGLDWAFEPKALVNEYTDYLKIMAHFRDALPGRVIDVLYDDVVKDSDRYIRELVVKKIGLQWHDR